MNSPPSDAGGRSRRTLRKRLLLFLLLPLAALLVISLAADYHFAFAPADEAYDHALIDDAVALAGRVHTARGIIEVDLPPAAEAVLRSDSTDQEFLAIYAPDGKLLTGDADLTPDPVGLANPRLTDATLRGKKIRKASFRVDTSAGPVTVAVAETTRKRDLAGSKILVAMILPNVLLIVATLCLVYVGVRSGLAPLTHLSEEIARRAPHDLGPLPQSAVPGEAEPLIKAMDSLIDDLRTAAVAQQAFLANAAHQLKTPLASLQTQLELAAAEIPGEYRHRVDHLQDATQRLGHLTHQLLALARSGPEANVAHEWRRVDLGEFLTANAPRWIDQAIAKDIDLGFEPGATAIEGSEWLLAELLSNLVDNALRYTQAGGKVTARSGVVPDGRAFLEVEDDGPGIAESERVRIFDRFYRAGGSPGAGTGLGLAIVKEGAERHGATTSVAGASAAGGTRIRVVFPPATASRPS